MNASLHLATAPLVADARGGDLSQAPGRSCPLTYRYSASVFARTPELHADTLYVVGGLYGNPFALDAIEALFAQEAGSKRMVFNGDFHWFDIDPALFANINIRVHQHTALRGNVETELASADADAGCGCAYPSHVDDADVARSNAILLRLRQTAQTLAGYQALGRLPMHSVAQIGAARIAIVHGDAESLAGWQFDPSALHAPTGQAWLDRVFEQAQVDVFASSHTCTPGLRQWQGQHHATRAVINNGSAGMGHAAGSTHGTVTRISVHPAPAGVRVWNETQVGGVFLQAICVPFDDALWQARFLVQWPPGSPAHVSYWSRVCGGAGDCLVVA